MMYYLKKRTSNLRGLLGFFIILSLDILLFLFSYENNLVYLSICTFLYLFIDKILLKTTKDHISFHIYNGVLKVLENMEKRDGIINFYVIIIALSYVLSLYLVSIHLFVGYLCFGLIIFTKILAYILCYKYSLKNSY